MVQRGFSQYADVFREEGVTGVVLAELNNEDLKNDLNVLKLGDRKMLLKLLRETLGGESPKGRSRQVVQTRPHDGELAARPPPERKPGAWVDPVTEEQERLAYERRREECDNRRWMWMKDLDRCLPELRLTDGKHGAAVGAVPSETQQGWLRRFLQHDYDGAPKNYFWPVPSVRIGYDSDGVFIQQDHLRFYVGKLCAGDSPSADERAAQELVKSQVLEDFFHLTFQVADKNKDGRVDKSELGLLLRRAAPRTTPQQIKEVFEMMDRNHDGGISCGEFVAFMKSHAGSNLSDTMQKQVLKSDTNLMQAVFQLYDVNGDGAIQVKEFSRVLTQVCKGTNVAEKVDRILALVDQDKDGTIDYHEFVEALCDRRC